MNRYGYIGVRLRDWRQRARLTTDQVCQATGISRALLYRYESGDVVKLEVLDRLANLYETSTGALLGLSNEYVTHGMIFFDRVQRLEEEAISITTVFGPQAYMLSSEHYDDALLRRLGDHRDDQPALAIAEAQRLMYVLKKRKAAMARGQTTLVNIIPISDIRCYLENGLGGHPGMPTQERQARRLAAREEMRRLGRLIADPPMGVQLALTTQPLPTAGFELLKIGKRRLLVTSPFRIVEPLNLHFGVAMFSEDADVLRMHDVLVAQLWGTALKGAEACAVLERLLQEQG